jgi:[FeFe] hydrogenase H-cluster maturation GTPase HydF
MNSTPKSLRLQIGFFGRTNTGKSSLLNLIAGQDVAITAPVPGTTTDVVEKSMELLPIGPVVMLDTAGLDDTSDLGPRRIARTRAALERAEIAVLVCEPDRWTDTEAAFLAAARERGVPVLGVVNKTDLGPVAPEVAAALDAGAAARMDCSCVEPGHRERAVSAFKERLLRLLPEDAVRAPPLAGDLLPAGGWAVMIVPIDLQAPKGRLILPQVQFLRECLDHDAAVLTVKEREWGAFVTRMTPPPDLVVCDSQVVLKMTADTPPGIPCTTFSILMARAKGDLPELARGAAALDRLRAGDRVLIAESCSHHALEDDIGRVKIPRWLRQYTGVALHIDHVAGRDFPADLAGYRLVIQCGSCMLTRRETLGRIHRARAAGVPVTNYGLAIAATQGVLERVLSPFPAALAAWREETGGEGSGFRVQEESTGVRGQGSGFREDRPSTPDVRTPAPDRTECRPPADEPCSSTTEHRPPATEP